MQGYAPKTWDWGNINIFDLQLDLLDKNVGLESISENPYPHLNPFLLLDHARQVKILKTSSIELILQFGEGLENLQTFDYAIDLVEHNGVSHRWLVDHADQIKQLPPAAVPMLQSWARRMIVHDEQASNILINVLARNLNLRSVLLQVQEIHDYKRIMSRLATLRYLDSLTLEGTDVQDADETCLQSATETVLDILQQCQSLDALAFRPIPIQPSVLKFQATQFTSSITVLDLSGFNRPKDPTQKMNFVVYPFHVHKVVLHCPNLHHLAMPQRLPEAEIAALDPILSNSCPHLENLDFFDTKLNVPPFPTLMASIGTLKRLLLYDCRFNAYDFWPWLNHQGVQETIRSVFVEYDRLDQPHQCEVLMSMMPSDGTIDQGRSSWIRRQGI
ncbi:hypothetical protein BGZ65_011162 [Modicella reniformis]|uniref:Uncharacterized protein n=1 Tax=Modicella reniformis TaxID=1440133 RepID=A0A9P6IMA5_9FUNG|nr:hypothetical protein BGZ65_011162 [Modicella reniformis]